MHCEWVVLVILVSFDEPVTGPSPWSPEVLPRVFCRTARRSDARRAVALGNRASLVLALAAARPARLAEVMRVGRSR